MVMNISVRLNQDGVPARGQLTCPFKVLKCIIEGNKIIKMIQTLDVANTCCCTKSTRMNIKTMIQYKRSKGKEYCLHLTVNEIVHLVRL
jgi:hypothetical protein